MSTIADLLIKIGADSSGLNKELKDAKSQINKTFEPNPISQFQSALTGTGNTVDDLVGKFTKIAAYAGAGFGFASLVSGAASAGEKLQALSEKLNISTSEASMFSRTVTLAGGNVDIASGAIMRLDKNLNSSSDAGEKARATLAAVGVTLTDANGKLLPLNEQMQQLANGYRAAAAAGYQQEYIMNTLGTKGMALTDVLREYNAAKENAAKVKGVGLDPQQMDALKKQLDLLKMQSSSLGLAAGAALAPIVQEYLPNLISGLGQAAQWVAVNKTQVVDVTRSVVTLIAVYKTLQALRSAGTAVGGMLGSTTAQAAAAEALTAAQERAIRRRIALIENAALAEERAYYKTLQTMNMTEAEKTATFSKYVADREARAAQEAAVLRTQMTQAYAQINAAAVQSSGVQTAAIGKVTAATALSSAAMTGVGNAAVSTGVKMTTVATSGVGTIGKLTTAVWNLAGGWLGVASAIAVALKALYDYNKTYAKGWQNGENIVEYQGKTYRQVNGQWRERGEDAFNRDYDNPFLYGDDIKDKDLIDALNGAKEAKKKEKDEEDLKKTMGDLNSSIAEAMQKINAPTEAATKVGSAGSTGTRAPQTYQVERPIGEIAAENAINAYNEAPGSQWLNPELTDDMNRSCASFVATMYKATGALNDLYSNSGDYIEDQMDARGAWHDAGDGYIPEAGDYISGPDHVGMYVGNGQVISRDSDGGLQQRSVEKWKDLFGFIGYGSIREFTGGATATQTVDANGKAIRERINKLAEARNEALQLFRSMRSSITQETGTAYEAGMDQVAQDVQNKAQQIAKLSAAGLPSDAIKMLSKELADYRTAQMDRVEKARQQNMNKLETDTRQATAELRGDYYSLADAEYQATVDALDKEREERTKNVAKDKDDKEAMAAVEEWYTAQVQAANQKRTESYREAFAKQIEYAINNHNSAAFLSALEDPKAQQAVDWAGQTKAMQTYYDLWREAHKSMEEQTAEVAGTARDAFADFFKNIFTGEEGFGDSLLSLVDGVMESILEQISEKWASQITMTLFGGILNPDKGGGIDSLGGALGLGGTLVAGVGASDTTGLGALTAGLGGLTSGVNEAAGAISIMGSTTGTASTMLGTFNTVQGILNTTTKPAESATVIAATGSLTSLSAAAFAASTALASVSATAGFHTVAGIFAASGGQIMGPGTSTSDSIPAMLSTGEYVINAAAVSRVGAPLLDAINTGRSFRRFAGGGAVAGGSSVVMKAGNTIALSVSALDADSFVDFLRNGGGDTIKQMLLDNDRDYTGSTGVW